MSEEEIKVFYTLEHTLDYGKYAALSDKNISTILNYINKLKQENKISEEKFKVLNEEFERVKEQNEFLMKQDNILQSLEQWLKEENEEEINENDISSCYGQTDEYLIDRQIGARECLKGVLNKIKELKGSNNDKN